MAIVLFILGVICGGLTSWLITYRYYVKASNEQKVLVDDLSKNITETGTLDYFKKLLEQSKWKKEYINQREVWIAEKNNTYQIHQSEEGRPFDESWATVHSDPLATSYSVYLKIADTVIKELTFVSLDGGRIFVPITKREVVEGKIINYWVNSSLEVKVCNVIGYFYIFENLYKIARISKIEIR